MRKPFIAGNWKMHKTTRETAAFSMLLATSFGEFTDIDVAVAPPFTSLATMRAGIDGTNVRLAAQNMHWEEKGAFTGEVSGPMLKDAGCTYVILGHSERRQYFGEDDETVNRKVVAALLHGLIPILCVGETLDERDRGITFVVVDRQVTRGLKNVDKAQLPGIVIAYEPVWAIGTGRNATPEQAEEVHRAIRARLTELFSKEAADAVRILYGGSVKPENIEVLMAEPDIDGALVGGASLEIQSFKRICGFERRKKNA